MFALADGLFKLFHYGPIILFIIMLAAIDYFTTKKILNAGGIELNPIIKWCIDKKVFAPVKIALTLFVVIILWHYGAKYTKLMDITSAIIIAGYIYVIIHNILQLRKLGKLKEL